MLSTMCIIRPLCLPEFVPQNLAGIQEKILAGGHVLELFAGGSVGDSLAWLKGTSQHALIDKLNQDADDKVFSLAQLFAFPHGQWEFKT